MLGQIVKTASVKENESVSVAELQKGNYIVTGTVNNKPVSQKILKD
jgi:predicted aspartyl protease